MKRNIKRINDKHIEFLRSNIKGVKRSDLHAVFNREFGFNYSFHCFNNILKKNKLTNGLNFQFKKNHPPHNKGKKLWYRDKIEHTFFKKGYISYIRPKGSERIDTAGYTLVKTDDKKKWRAKHAVIWEEQNKKKIPKGYAVIFADGNKKNFLNDNLILVKRGELAIMNHFNLIKTAAPLFQSAKKRVWGDYFF
ncbi:MAG: HNH endonuclease [Endomicrobium sp.]|jgi:hypothetical protein|nr:HNH endonuclease [Endomicrobium sp.]